MRATGFDDGQGLADGLDAVHRLLHERIEILDAQAGAIEPGRGECADIVRFQETRVQLDREVRIVGFTEAEVPAQHVHRLRKLAGRKKIGCAATEMQLYDFPVTVEQCGSQLDFAIQTRQIDLALGEVPGDDPVASAIETRAHAEGHVDVDGKPARDRIFVAAMDGFAQFFGAEVSAELRRRRIRRISRPGAVVTPQQLCIKVGNGTHANNVGVLAWACLDMDQPHERWPGRDPGSGIERRVLDRALPFDIARLDQPPCLSLAACICRSQSPCWAARRMRRTPQPRRRCRVCSRRWSNGVATYTGIRSWARMKSAPRSSLRMSCGRWVCSRAPASRPPG